MSGRLYQLVATVPTGLEGGAVDEFKEVLGRKAEAERGKIRLEIASLEELKQVYYMCANLTYHTYLYPL